MLPNSTTSAMIGNILRQVDKLARLHTRSLDIQGLRFMVDQLADELAKPDALLCEQPRRRRRVPPGYWAERKRIQRARNKSRISTEELR